MPLKYLGKVLFPRSSPWQRANQMRILVGTIMVAMLVAATVTVLMLYVNSKR
jgi:hypothetical protein